MNKRILLILVSVLSFSLQIMGQQNDSAEELIKKFNQNSKKSLVANDELITDLKLNLKNEKILNNDKVLILDLLLSHFVEKGELIEFKRLYQNNLTLLKKDPLKMYFWESVSSNYSRAYLKSLSAAKKHLNEALKIKNNDEISKAYRILAVSNMFLNNKDSSLFYANL